MSEHTYTVPLSVQSSMFVGKKPVAVMFGEEALPTHTWVKVYNTIMQRVIQDPIYHDRLMELRNKLAGKVRFFVSDKPDTMRRPLKISEDLYCEVHYGSATLMHILVNIILKAIRYDHSDIKIIIKV